ncbi:hypothetical protein CP03DC29_1486, partial [Chlamydia psittaci 03DC29]
QPRPPKTGPQTGFERFKPVLTGTKQTRPAQTRPDRLKTVLIGSNRF